MAERLQVYKCEICGNMVEVLRGGRGTLTCCNQAMTLLKEGEVDAALEKHVPVVEEADGGILVKVGSVPHPMGSDHLIEWIEAIVDDRVYRKYLKPEDKPEAFFPVSGDNITVREFCNLHGLWKA
jgi:superoxide reductase